MRTGILIQLTPFFYDLNRQLIGLFKERAVAIQFLPSFEFGNQLLAGQRFFISKDIHDGVRQNHVPHFLSTFRPGVVHARGNFLKPIHKVRPLVGVHLGMIGTGALSWMRRFQIKGLISAGGLQ